MPTNFATSRRIAIKRLAGAGAVLTAAGAARLVMARVQVEDHRTWKTSDRQAVADAISAVQRAGGGEVHFAPQRVYRLGPLRPDETMFTLRDLRGVSLIGHGAHLECETVARGQTQLFLMQRGSDIAFRDLIASDRGADLRQDWRGMDFLHCDTTAGPITGVHMSDLVVDGAVSALTVTGQASGPRATDFTLDRLVARNCYYGVSFQENGDRVQGSLTAHNCRRPYFAYGVRDHRWTLAIDHDGQTVGGDCAILVKRYLLDTAGIDLTARFEGVLAWSNLVKLEQQPPAGQWGSIDDVTINLTVAQDARNPHNAVGVGFSSYRDRKLVERSSDRWGRTVVRACFGPIRQRMRHYTQSQRAQPPVLEQLGDCG